MKNLLPIRQIKLEELSVDTLKEDRPVVIKGGCAKWPASAKWGMKFFEEKYGEIDLPMSNYKEDPYQRASDKPSMALNRYFHEVEKVLNHEPTAADNLYSAGWYFTKGNCELLKDMIIPETFQDNWAAKVQKVLYFDTTSILFGHPKVESPLHTDSFFVSTWFACVVGQKRIRLVEPKYTEHVCNGYNVFDDEKMEELCEKDVPVYEATIEEGDIFWFPPGWWHHVKNDTFTISVTTNFVSSHHFLPFEQQVRSTLLKPLLGLAKLRGEAISQSAGSVEDLSDLECSLEGIKDSNYINGEKKYVYYMQKQTEKTLNLLERLEKMS